jgi:hypothetical protein
MALFLPYEVSIKSRHDQKLNACSPFPVVASGFKTSVRGMVDMDDRSFQLCHSKKSSVLARAVLIKFYPPNVMDPCENTSIPERPFLWPRWAFEHDVVLCDKLTKTIVRKGLIFRESRHWLIRCAGNAI